MLPICPRVHQTTFVENWSSRSWCWKKISIGEFICPQSSWWGPLVSCHVYCATRTTYYRTHVWYSCTWMCVYTHVHMSNYIYYCISTKMYVCVLVICIHVLLLRRENHECLEWWMCPVIHTHTHTHTCYVHWFYGEYNVVIFGLTYRLFKSFNSLSISNCFANLPTMSSQLPNTHTSR